MQKILGILVLGVSVLLGACAKDLATLQAVTGIYKTATETTVPANVVIPTANAFNILKVAATNYGQYCIDHKMPEPVCSAGNRRIVIKAVRVGTGARDKMVASIKDGQPALSSIYNLLVGAVNDLQASPAAKAQFTGAPQ